MAKVVKCNFLCLTKDRGRVVGKDQCNIKRIREETLCTVSFNQPKIVLSGYTIITVSSVEKVEYQSPTVSADKENQSPILKASLQLIPLCLVYSPIIKDHLIYIVIQEPQHNSLENGLLDQWMRQTLTSISVDKASHEYCIVQIVGGNIGVQNACILLLDHLRLNLFNSSN